MTIRVLVCGGRRYNDPLTLGSWLGGIHKQRGISMIIQGGAEGADRLARLWAQFADVPLRTFHAAWDTHGKAAGPIRNRTMIQEGKPDLVVAFPGSNGTANMVAWARQAGVEVLEVTTPIQ